jgi:hypothetical protein
METSIRDIPSFQLVARERISATPAEVYAVISDLPRSGEWSAECTGGRWVSGEPATVGAVFNGENFRPANVVGWAPVVRGTWSTESEVVEAVPGGTFSWAMRDAAGRRQESVWSFEITPADGGSELAHRFRMDAPTEGIRGITAEMDATERTRFFDEWSAKLATDLTATVARIKTVIENQ